MIIAIPMTKGEIAVHFTKAETVAFFDKEGASVAHFENPALQENCEGKAKMVELMKAQNANCVLVKNVGQRMLGRLLANGIEVRKTNSAPLTLKSLNQLPLENYEQLISPDQGSRSPLFETKRAQGKTCCGSDPSTGYQKQKKCGSSGKGCCH